MMRVWLVPFFAVALGCSTAKVNVAEKSPGPEHSIVSGCSIQDTSGKLLWSYPDWMCIFLPDGRFVSGGVDGLILHGADQKTIWHLNLNVHHMMSLAENGDILVLASDWNPLDAARPPFESTVEVLGKNQSRVIPGIPRKFAKEKFRVDRLVRVSPEGKIVAERSFFNDKEFPMTRLKADYVQKKTPLALTPFEVSHFNSIYEIGANASPLPAFRAGNILINDNQSGFIFITDPGFKKILWKLSVDILGHQSVHDVQILPDGHLLFLRNVGLHDPISSLERVDPMTLQTSWKYIDLVEQSFRAIDRGSVQELSGGRHLFAYSRKRKSWAKLLDANNKIVWELDMFRHYDANIQSAYSLPVESFLQHNKAL